MIAGAGAGAAKALEQILAEQMVRAQEQQRIRENEARMQVEQQRLAESSRQFNVRAEAEDRERRDRNNTRGIELMRADKQEMDTEQALGSLPEHLKPIAGLMRIGAVGKLGMEDFQTPEQREAAARAEEERQIRIRRASIGPAQPKEKKQIWVTRGGVPTPIEEGSAQPGDVPYDPVAARSSQPKDQAEAQDTAREAGRLATELLKHKGFPRAFGTIDAVVPSIFSQDKADAESIRDALTSMLTLENMGKMKGVLSDSDMRVLRQASTTLNAKMSDGAARKELRRVARVMAKVTGEADPFPEDDQQQPGQVDPQAQALIDKYRPRPK